MAGSEMKYVGVDGATCGWFSVGLDDDAGFEVKVFEEFAELVKHYSNACLILIDMPIGLEKNGLGKREADGEAQRIMGRRNGTVFYPPSREYARQLDGLKHKEAKEKASSWKQGWKGFAQAISIVPKIIEVDKVIRPYAKGKLPKIRETHPEICFWALNGKQTISHGKAKSKGRRKRIKVLMDCESQTKDILYSSETAKSIFNNDVATHDILDALVAAVTAKLGCQPGSGWKLKTLPSKPPKDSKCLPMEMVYVEP